MEQVEFEVGPDKVVVVRLNGHRLELDAESLSAMIRRAVLARERLGRVAPERSPIETGGQFSFAESPAWYVRSLADGTALLSIQHPGVGWINSRWTRPHLEYLHRLIGEGLHQSDLLSASTQMH